VSLDGVKLHEGWPVPGDRRVRPTRSPERWERFRHWRWRWLAWLVLAIVVIVTASVSILLNIANDYLPLTYGLDGMGGLAYPGLPAGHGIRNVNTFGHVREDIYIPPQRGTFYLFASVLNTGTRTVIIEKVSLPKYSKLIPAGPVRYARPSGGYGTSGIPAAKRILRNVKLGQTRRSSSRFRCVPGHARRPGTQPGPWFRGSTSATGSCSSITSRRCLGDLMTT
jgi:hypothetical protein